MPAEPRGPSRRPTPRARTLSPLLSFCFRSSLLASCGQWRRLMVRAGAPISTETLFLFPALEPSATGLGSYALCRIQSYSGSRTWSMASTRCSLLVLHVHWGIGPLHGGEAALQAGRRSLPMLSPCACVATAMLHAISPRSPLSASLSPSKTCIHRSRRTWRRTTLPSSRFAAGRLSLSLPSGCSQSPPLASFVIFVHRSIDPMMSCPLTFPLHIGIQ